MQKKHSGANTDTLYPCVGNGYWWLRSPGNSNDTAASVFSSGYLYDYGSNVNTGTNAVRPALHLDLSCNIWGNAGTVSSDGSETGGDDPSDFNAKVKNVSLDLYSKYNSIKASWSKIANATGYLVEYKAAGASSWSKSKLKSGKKYSVRVKPYITQSGTKYFSDSYSATKTVYTLKTCSLKGSKSGKTAKLKWTNISGESGYQLYRSSKKTSGFKLLKTLAANKYSFTDKKVKKGKTYYYKVRAYKKAGSKKISAPWSKAVKVKI